MKDRVWILSVAFVILCWVIGCVQTQKEKDYQLEYKFKEGDTYTVVNKLTLKLEADLNDKVKEWLEKSIAEQLGFREELSYENPIVDGTIELEMSWEVESVKDGVATIKQKAKAIRMKGEAFGQEINVENLDDLRKTPFNKRIPQGSQQEQILQIDKCGSMKLAGQEDLLIGTLSGLGVFPRKKVKVGDVWIKEAEKEIILIFIVVPFKIKTESTSTCELEKMEQRGDTELATVTAEGEFFISFSSEQTDVPKQTGVDIKLKINFELKGKSKGTYTFNITKGVQGSSNWQTTLEFSLSSENPETGERIDIKKAELNIDVDIKIKPDVSEEVR